MAKRIISTTFWEDEKVVDMFSPEDKYFMLYLLTNPRTTAIGIYGLPRKIAAFDLGYTVDSVNVLLDRFENKYEMIYYSAEQQEVAVLNALKYSISKGGKPIEDMVDREMNSVKSDESIYRVYENLKDWWGISGRKIDGYLKKLFEAELSKRKVPKEKNANTNVNATANANTGTDNVTVDVTYNDTLKKSNNSGDLPLSKNVFKAWEELWMFPNHVQQQILIELTNLYSDELVVAAIKIAGSKDVIKGRAINFIEAVLKEWEDNNVKDIEQARAYQRNRNNQKRNRGFNQNNNNAIVKGPMPDWAMESNDDVEDEEITEESQQAYAERLERLRKMREGTKS